MKPKRKLTKIFSLMLSGVSLVSIILIGALWISFESNRSEQEVRQIRSDYLASHRATISLETNRICDYIEARRQSSEIRFLKNIRERAYEAYNLVEASYKEAGDAADSPQTKALILAGLKGVSYNEGRGRYSVLDFDGENLLKPDVQADAETRAHFSDVAVTLEQTEEGYFKYNLNPRAQADHTDTQISYLKIFRPYKWIIGTSEYASQWTRDIQAEMLFWASGMAMPDGADLIIIDYYGDILAHPDRGVIGSNIFADLDNPPMQKIMAEIIRGAKTLSSDFIEHTDVNPKTGMEKERIGYYRAIPAWNWAVIILANLDDMEAVMAERQTILAKNVQSQISRIVIISISMLLVIMLLSKVLSSLAIRSFSAFFQFFERASTSSTEMNPDEQPFEEFARLALAANNMINQRKLATKLLRESELKFKTVFDVSPQVITISDHGGILLDANEEYKRYSRIDLNQATGRPIEDSFVVSPEKRKELWDELKKHRAVIGEEVEAVGLDGKPIVFLVFGKMIQMHVSSFILLIFTNITALKRAEHDKLVLQEKLSRSTKMEAMGLMAAEVAHDLNNILSGIIGYPQLLLMEPNITEKQKESLQEILSTGQRAAAVVKDLLTIARGVANAKVSLPVNDIIQGYVNSPECRQLQDIFPNVELKLDLSPKAGNIQGSSVHLSKVIMNLVSNAFEAMPPDKADGRVTIKTESLEPGQGLPLPDDTEEGSHRVMISVIDNGPGIPPEDVDKIFEPFYSKKIKGRSGTGLGLAIVWNTITDHGGRLDIATGTEGTTFQIVLRQTLEKSAEIVDRRNLTEYRGDGQRILVVDDVDIQRKLAGKMLKSLGYQPSAVPSGEAAVELLKKEDFDLVILDMIMHPGMNGRETYASIMEFKPNQKAIIASGMAETDEVAKAQAMGAGQFVNKPYTIEELAAAVKKALNA